MKLHQPRYGRWLFSLAAVVAVPVALVLFRPDHRATPAVHAEPGAEAGVKADAVTVKVVRPQSGGVERTTSQPATIRAFEYEELYAKVSGYLVREKVDIGSVVKEGEILAEIDAPELIQDELHAKAALQQAESQVRQMQAHVTAARAEKDAAEKLIDQRAAELKRAKSNLAFREKQYNRVKELADYKSVDQRLVDEQFDHYESAQAQRDAAVAGIATAKADVAAKEAKVLQAQADLDAARANVGVAQAVLQKARVFVEFTSIRSHYNGVVTARNYHNGDYIRTASNGDLPLFTVQRTDLMRVIVQVPDADVPFSREGDPADLAIATLPPSVKFAGLKVSRISRSQDQKSRTMRVEVDVPNDKQFLRDGMYGMVTIHFMAFQAEQASATRDAVRVPSSALRRAHDKVLAYVVKDNVVHTQPVQIGSDNGAVAEVLAGLSPNDMLVDQPSAQLRDGTSVRIVAGPTAAH